MKRGRWQREREREDEVGSLKNDEPDILDNNIESGKDHMGDGRKNEHRLFPTKDDNSSSEETATRIPISQVAGTIRSSSHTGRAGKCHL